MDILTNVEEKVKGLDTKVAFLTKAQIEHEKFHYNNMELMQDKMIEMNYKILEIRTLTGFTRTRDSIMQGIPEVKREEVTNTLAKLYGMDKDEKSSLEQDVERDPICREMPRRSSVAQ